MKTVDKCLNRLIDMVESHKRMRRMGIFPSFESTKITVAYGQAIKSKFGQSDISAAVDELLAVAGNDKLYNIDYPTIDKILEKYKGKA